MDDEHRLQEEEERRQQRQQTQRSARAYWTSSKTLNIGRYMEITTRPTMAPTRISMIGSMMEVRAFRVAATSSS